MGLPLTLLGLERALTRAHAYVDVGAGAWHIS